MGTNKKNGSKTNHSHGGLVKGRNIRPGILEVIRKERPEFGDHDTISVAEMNKYRQQYIENTLKEEVGTLTKMEHQVIESITTKEFVSDNVIASVEQKLSYGQRLADKIASFGGSWKFIIIFLSFILVWMIINIIFLMSRAFDPYPFILLNLILSCLAALQAPVIMMSQNRQEEKDRERARNDYQVNLKSELEIRMLHEKMDHLMQVQQERLLEIQEIQIDMIRDMMTEVTKLRSK
jgi:uncharacterized membrane protein